MSLMSSGFTVQTVEVHAAGEAGRVIMNMGHLIEGDTMAERFEYAIWYAPDLGRYVRLEHRSWSAFNNPLTDERVELVEYKGRN